MGRAKVENTVDYRYPASVTCEEEEGYGEGTKIQTLQLIFRSTTVKYSITSEDVRQDIALLVYVEVSN
jgi:hypothetical protein